MAAALMLIVSGCSSVPSSTTHKVESFAITDLGDSPLGRLATDLSSWPAAEFGVGLPAAGSWSRALWPGDLFMADNAVRTIDAQYFLWKNDRLGRTFIQRLMGAAERGVRVRVIVDDSMTESDPLYLAKFGAHPNVQLRLYKPFGPPHKSYVLRWLDFAADFKLLNRRMHNKLFHCRW